MTDDASEPIPPKKSKRRLLIAVVGGALVLGGGAAALLLTSSSQPPPPPPPPDAAPVVAKKKPEPPKVGIEYAYDRNALVDTRRIAPRLLALAKAGNLLAFNEDSLEFESEKIFPRAATCLGPVVDRQLVVGLASGSLLRVQPTDYSSTEIGVVPGIPRWIRSQGKSFLVVYQPARPRLYDTSWRLRRLEDGKEISVPHKAVFYVGNSGQVWLGDGSRVLQADFAAGTLREVAFRGLGGPVEGFFEPEGGVVWAYGGSTDSAYVIRVDGKPAPIYMPGKGKAKPETPDSAIKAIVESTQDDSYFLLTTHHIYSTNRKFTEVRLAESLSDGDRSVDGVRPAGQVHTSGDRLLFALGRGGILEVSPNRFRRHLMRDQNTVVRPMEIARLGEGMAIYGDGGPRYLVGKAWKSLPDAVSPPAELMGKSRTGGGERVWAAMMTLPIAGELSYVIAKAGAPRNYVGHIHGIHDTVLTAKWDGTTMTVLAREDLPIEPEDTFMTPDRQLWNVDDQGLWNFSAGRWRLVMRTEDPRVQRKANRVVVGPGTLPRSAIGEPLHFVDRNVTPYFGTPRLSSGWSLVRLDPNEAGGVPLIEELVVKMDDRRLRIHDAVVWGNQREHLLLATDQGLCAYNIRFGACEPVRPEGVSGEVTLFRRDGTKRMWLGGKGLWILRDKDKADPLHAWVPMLADTRVLSLSEMPDGRMMVGLEGRGIVIVDVPSGWFARPESVVEEASVEKPQDHEPVFTDPGLQLRACHPETVWPSDAALQAFVRPLEDVVRPMGPRARVEVEMNYEYAPDLALRGADPDALLKAVTPILDKDPKHPMAIFRRAGARGSVKVEARRCP